MLAIEKRAIGKGEEADQQLFSNLAMATASCQRIKVKGCFGMVGVGDCAFSFVLELHPMTKIFLFTGQVRPHEVQITANLETHGSGAFRHLQN